MNKTILIVDDSQLVQQMYSQQLKNIAGKLLHAQDGIEAINIAITEQPDLILLDIQMPRINGYQVCRLLKDRNDTKNITIVIMTSRSSEGPVLDPRTWSFQTGADGYFDKDSGEGLEAFIKPFLEKNCENERKQALSPMSEMEILTAISRLLDRQLYTDVTRLKELNERKNAFVANVSHEFKSPLGIIKGFLDNLKDGICGPLSQEQLEAVRICLNTSNRLSRLVFDLLDLAKIEAGKMELEMQEVDMDRLISQTIETFSLEMKKKGVSVKKEFDYDLRLIMGDQDKLTQVIVNLLSNSLKYSPENGVITFRLFYDNDFLRFEIEDTGPGISPDYMAKIFDKFERVKADKREGTGLGLAVAKDIVDLHKGQIWVESEQGKGAKFIVKLPVPKI
ncbi:MAG: response regulator [Candidatus Omnitrophica bacterium]|nr:response regulator [Candidatus Omnitrophota bacterium]